MASMLRTQKRARNRANGIPNNRGPAKNSRGKVKGPARTPSIIEARAMARAQIREEMAKAERINERSKGAA